MKVAGIFLILATQAGFATQTQHGDLGRTAAECGFFYFSSGNWAPIATDQQRNAAKSLQNIMFSIAKRNGVSSEEFRKIVEPYKRELDQHILGHDRAFIQSEADRCGALAKREAEEAQAKKQTGD
ncbi:MAG: hypothetical protein ACRD5Z_10840 [Bryobacteraceae bacterium]